VVEDVVVCEDEDGVVVELELEIEDVEGVVDV
jgi:hypothetical protein